METFSALLAICAGNSPVPGEFLTQRPVTRSFDVFFDLHPNKWLSKQWWGWWFETLSCPLWRHRNDISDYSNRQQDNLSKITYSFHVPSRSDWQERLRAEFVVMGEIYACENTHIFRMIPRVSSVATNGDWWLYLRSNLLTYKHTY